MSGGRALRRPPLRGFGRTALGGQGGGLDEPVGADAQAQPGHALAAADAPATPLHTYGIGLRAPPHIADQPLQLGDASGLDLAQEEQGQVPRPRRRPAHVTMGSTIRRQLRVELVAHSGGTGWAMNSRQGGGVLT